MEHDPERTVPSVGTCDDRIPCACLHKECEWRTAPQLHSGKPVFLYGGADIPQLCVLYTGDPLGKEEAFAGDVYDTENHLLYHFDLPFSLRRTPGEHREEYEEVRFPLYKIEHTFYNLIKAGRCGKCHYGCDVTCRIRRIRWT